MPILMGHSFSKASSQLDQPRANFQQFAFSFEQLVPVEHIHDYETVILPPDTNIPGPEGTQTTELTRDAALGD